MDFSECMAKAEDPIKCAPAPHRSSQPTERPMLGGGTGAEVGGGGLGRSKRTERARCGWVEREQRKDSDGSESDAKREESEG